MGIHIQIWSKGIATNKVTASASSSRTAAQAGQRFQLLDDAGQPIRNAAIKRVGTDAVIEVPGQPPHTLEGFYAQPDVAVFTDGALGNSQLVLTSNGFNGVVFDAAAPIAKMDALANAASSLGAGSIAAIGLGVLALASVGGGGKDPVAAPPTGQLITGGSSNENLLGGAGNDTINAGGGNDTLTGGAGSDTLDGGTGTNTASYAAEISAVTVDLTAGTATGAGSGSDTLISIQNLTTGSGADSVLGSASANLISAGEGSDTVSGEAGNDTLNGGGGNDALNGGTENDRLFGDAGSDTLHGDNGSDTVDGGDNDDVLHGDQGTDLLLGGLGNDSLYGGTEDDTLDGGTGNDLLNGGAGNNTATYAAYTGAQTLDLVLGTASGAAGSDTLTAISHLIGGSGNDQLIGNSGNNSLDGGAGADTVQGAAGNDTLLGNGADSLLGGADNDTYQISTVGVTISDASGALDVLDFSRYTASSIYLDLAAGNTVLDALAGATVLTDQAGGIERYNGTNNADTLIAGSGDIVFDGGSGNDSITLGAGSNTVYGGIGDDRFTGGAGNSTIDGGFGNDHYTESSGADSFLGGLNNDTVVYADDAFVDNFYGGAGEDVADLSASNASTTIDLTANSALIIVSNGTQSDFFYEFEGYTLGSGADLMVGDANNNAFNAGDGANTLRGGQGNDTLTGGAQGDLITDATSTTTGEGADWVYGNGGDDTIEMNNANATNTARDYVYGGADNDLITLLGQAYNVEGDGGNDHIVLSNTQLFADYISGGQGNDILDGFYGQDTVDGGTGNDVLFAYQTINASNANRIYGIEKIDLSSAAAPVTLVITAQDVLAMSDAGELIVHGDAADHVYVSIAGWTQSASPVMGFDGQSYTAYTQTVGTQTATLLIDTSGGVTLH